MGLLFHDIVVHACTTGDDYSFETFAQLGRLTSKGEGWCLVSCAIKIVRESSWPAPKRKASVISVRVWREDENRGGHLCKEVELLGTAAILVRLWILVDGIPSSPALARFHLRSIFSVGPQLSAIKIYEAAPLLSRILLLFFFGALGVVGPGVVWWCHRQGCVCASSTFRLRFFLCSPFLFFCSLFCCCRLQIRTGCTIFFKCQRCDILVTFCRTYIF